MDAQLLQSLLATLQAGRISFATFAYNLKRGELLPEGRTVEEELDLIDQTPIPTGVLEEEEEDDELNDEDEDDDEDNDEDDNEDNDDDDG